MRSTVRLFLAALALISTTAFARAQDSAAPVPVSLDAFGTPVSALSELPAIPFADGRASVREPALTIDPSAVTIEPIAPSAPANGEPSAADQSPAHKFSIEVTQSFEHAAGAASLASLSTVADPAPPNAAAHSAQVKSLEAEVPNKTGTGGWIFLGLVVVALFTSITRYRRRLPKRYSFKPIASLPLDPGTGPVPVPVPARTN